MKKINKEPLSQVERNRRYRETHNLVYFSVAIEEDLYNQLRDALNNTSTTRKEFLIDAIKNFLKGK